GRWLVQWYGGGRGGDSFPHDALPIYGMVAPSIIHFVDIRGKAPFNRLPFPFPIESLVGLPLGIWFSTCPARNIKVGSNADVPGRSEEHTSELQSRGHLVCRLLLEKIK